MKKASQSEGAVSTSNSSSSSTARFPSELLQWQKECGPITFTPAEVTNHAKAVNENGLTILQTAIQLNKIDLIKMIVESRLLRVWDIDCMCSRPPHETPDDKQVRFNFSMILDLLKGLKQEILDHETKIIMSAKKVWTKYDYKKKLNLISYTIKRLLEIPYKQGCYSLRTVEEIIEILDDREVDEEEKTVSLYQELFENREEILRWLLDEIIKKCLNCAEDFAKAFKAFDIVTCSDDLERFAKLYKPMFSKLYTYQEFSLLQHAALNGRYMILTYLLEKDTDPDIWTRNGYYNILHCAAMAPSSAGIIIDQLVVFEGSEWKYWLDQRDALKKWTPMHIAAKLNNYEAIVKLCFYGAAYDVEDSDRNIPRQLASDDRCTNVLDKVEDLFASIEVGNEEVFKSIEKLENPWQKMTLMNVRNARGETPITMFYKNTSK